MKKLLLSGIALVSLALPALAADLPRKAPAYTPPPPPPPLTWNGWYIGLNVGAGWNNNDFDNVQNSTFCNPALSSTVCANLLGVLGRGVPLAFGTGNDAGFIGGGQFGWNYQTGAVVWGFEADFQGADINRAGAVTNTVNLGSLSPFLSTTNLTETGIASQRLNFLGTLRGRLGWTPSPPWLLYLTGGLAYGHLETSVGFSQHIGFGPGLGFLSPFFPDRSSFISKDDWRAGWTVGGGVEWMFAPRWSFKAEYLYYDLGHQNLDSQLDTVVVVGGTTTRLVGVGIASEASNKGSIARAGINYHFGAY